MTTEGERARLLRVARDAITAYVIGSASTDVRGPWPADAESADDIVQPAPRAQRGGVFVSIHHRGELRGCIGHIESIGSIGSIGADDSLPAVITRCAVAACSEDPRFPAVTPAELPEIQIELSVLGPLEPAAGPTDVEVGRHGLVVEMGQQRGLLLPQVATEWQWDAEAFLSQTCRKAGLRADSWQRGARVWRFEAEVFSEEPSY